MEPGGRAVFATLNWGYIFGHILAPKGKNGKRLRLAVVHDEKTHLDTGSGRVTRMESHPVWDRVVATYYISPKTRRLIGWVNPIDHQKDTWGPGLPRFYEMYDEAKAPYTKEIDHDW